MPALPASHVPERSRRGAGSEGPEGGPDKPGLFQGFIWASGRAAANTATNTAIKTTRRGRIAESSCQRARGLYAYNPAKLRGRHEMRTSVHRGAARHHGNDAVRADQAEEISDRTADD